MKHTKIVTGLMAILIAAVSFAAKTPESEEAQTSFKKQFTQATDVFWSKVGDKEKVSFILNGRVLFAYYTANGQLLSVSRNILSTELPITLSMHLKKHYDSYWIKSLNETAADNGTVYNVTLENADDEIVLKSTNFSEWEVFQKFKKSI